MIAMCPSTSPLTKVITGIKSQVHQKYYTMRYLQNLISQFITASLSLVVFIILDRHQQTVKEALIIIVKMMKHQHFFLLIIVQNSLFLHSCCRDFQRKQNTIKRLKRKALNRNPDEFYFNMVKTQKLVSITE